MPPACKPTESWWVRGLEAARRAAAREPARLGAREVRPRQWSKQAMTFPEAGGCSIPRGRFSTKTPARAPPAITPLAPHYLVTCSRCARLYSRSIINSFGKSLSDLILAAQRLSLTVILTGIPKRSIHHQSTSIEDSRHRHDGQLSRSIDIHGVFERVFSGARGVLARREVTNGMSASNTLSCCRIESSWRSFYRHDIPARTRRVSAHPRSALRLPSTA